MEPVIVTPVSPQAPTVGLAEAAKLCGCSAATIRRKKALLVGYGATAGDHGWTIPVPALVRIGLLDRVSPPDTPAKAAGRGMEGDTAPLPDGEVSRLRAAVVAAEHLAELLEVKLRAVESQAALQAEALNDMRAAWSDARRMLAITVGPVVTPTPPPMAAPADEQAPAATPRRWWRRQPAANIPARLPQQVSPQSQGL